MTVTPFLRGGVEKPLAVEPTQDAAIEKARKLEPDAAIHVERVRNVEGSGSHLWTVGTDGTMWNIASLRGNPWQRHAGIRQRHPEFNRWRRKLAADSTGPLKDAIVTIEDQ